MNKLVQRRADSRVPTAIEDIARGKPVIVLDDPRRENEADLVFAAELASHALLGFLIRHSSGIICCALSGDTCDRLRLPLMVELNSERMGTAFTVSVDAAAGTTTGISPIERASTFRVLASLDAQPQDLLRPGHVFPLRARDGGVLTRPGHTEAALDLTVLAGLRPAGGLCELVDDIGEPMRGEDVMRFADTHALTVISIAELAEFRLNLQAPLRLPG